VRRSLSPLILALVAGANVALAQNGSSSIAPYIAPAFP